MRDAAKIAVVIVLVVGLAFAAYWALITFGPGAASLTGAAYLTRPDGFVSQGQLGSSQPLLDVGRRATDHQDDVSDAIQVDDVLRVLRIG